MGSQTFLGKPSAGIEQWIKNQKLKEPLCFTAVDAGATIAFNKAGSPDEANIVTSTDKRTWEPYEFNTVVTLANPGDKVYFRAADENDISFWKSDSAYYRFAMTAGKKIAASGNIQTLLKADGSRLDISGKDHCYDSMFFGCAYLISAPALPATTLANNCYQYMFNGCTSLTAAPALPVTNLVNSCYYNMFSGCTSLTTAPELPATILADSCYSYMFSGCTSLTTASVLPATTLASHCYTGMFRSCTSLTAAPVLPAITLASSCYDGMFRECSSLTTAPELPATTLASSCYFYMFYDCSKLASIDVSFSAWSPTNATTSWVTNVGTQAAGEKTFTCPAALPKTIGVSNIPEGWTIVEK